MYQQVIFDLPELSAEETALLPLYTTCATELGVGDKTYLDMQKEQASIIYQFIYRRFGCNVFTNT